MRSLIPAPVESLLVGWLDARMSDWDVGVTVEHRNGFVKVELLGGNRQGFVHDYPMVALQVWHPDRVVAERGCAEAFAHAHDLTFDGGAGRPVRNVETIAYPQYFPDGETSTPRYQATVQLNIRPGRSL